MQKDTPTRLWAAFALAVLILWAHPASIVDGWAWFAVPLGAPPIGWAHAFGIALLFNAVSAKGTVQPKPAKAEQEDALTSVSRTTGSVLAGWGLMALAHWLPIWWVS